MDNAKKTPVQIIGAMLEDRNTGHDKIGAYVRDQYQALEVMEHRANAHPEIAGVLDRILDLTFHDAVNGHLTNGQTLTREQIGEIYEAARLLRAKVQA